MLCALEKKKKDLVLSFEHFYRCSIKNNGETAVAVVAAATVFVGDGGGDVFVNLMLSSDRLLLLLQLVCRIH